MYGLVLMKNILGVIKNGSKYMKSTKEILNGRNLIDFLYRCRTDFRFFAEELLEMTECGGVQDFHLEWVNLIENNKKVMIQAPSGFAKTTVLEMFVVWTAWKEHDKKIMIIANTEERAKQIISNITNLTEKNDLIRDLKPKNYRDTWNKQELRTSTKCRIFSKPYTPNMRGERSDFTLVDEADAEAYRNVKIFKEHVLSRLNPNSKIVLISTPDSTTGLMNYLLNTDKKNIWVFRKYKAIINMKVEGDYSTGESLWQDRFTLKELLERIDGMGEDAFRKIYMCDEKAESEDSIFKLRHIMACYDEDYKFEAKATDGFVVLACDFSYSDSPRADFDCFIILERKDNFFIIRHIETHKGITNPIKVSRIVDLHKQYRPHLLVCDSSNIGSTAIDDLYGRGLSVIPQKFSSQERKDLLLVLKNVIENKKLIIPRDQEDSEGIDLTNTLTEQLLGFVEKISDNTGQKLWDSTAPHDDIAITLAMAVKEASKQITGDFY